MSDQEPAKGVVTSGGTGQTDAVTVSTVAPAAFPARKPHKKSRTGCATCKARKIKCDERHPSCLNCISHGVECPFSSFIATTPVPPNRPKPKSRSPGSYLPPPTPTPPLRLPQPDSGPAHGDLPLLELELLHNFSTLTYSTLAADPGVCDFWRVTVVQIGLRCDYIMRAVLAISALHLAYHRPDRRDFYTAQGILLHQRAARSAMQSIAPEGGVETLDDAVNLFLFSMLTIYFALASPRRSLADGSFFIGEIDIDNPGGTGFPDWMFLLNGSKSLSNLLAPHGYNTVLAPFLAYGHGRWAAHRDNPSPSSSPSPLSTLRQHILSSTSNSPNGGLLATYSHALDELELALSARQDEAAPRDVLDAMLWLWEVSDSLMPLLKPNPNPDPNISADSPTPPTSPPQEAVAIFAHFSILLKHHESHWWLQGWAVHLISRAYEILDEEHRAWIEWPMREVGWTPGL